MKSEQLVVHIGSYDPSGLRHTQFFLKHHSPLAFCHARPTKVLPLCLANFALSRELFYTDSLVKVICDPRLVVPNIHIKPTYFFQGKVNTFFLAFDSLYIRVLGG